MAKFPEMLYSLWSGVLQYKNSTDKRPFEELGTYAMACLTTPTSNAVVERIFSTVTNVKTKSRNRLGSEMLDAIIRVRSHLQFQGCCRDFKVTPHMMELFNSANIYEKEEPGDGNRLDVFAYVN
ncbi:putative hAT family C-terminal dimerization region-containing protein 16 [Homarus americanus]|uniref:Putative hAT family C-terminal dimerization region-containing protein 16 n=1 Tax=Homarus americanus TaxID=6706 RepID=A0A8J5JJS1_HOMAM|nr:putative hAT family C-terminal dimerization region-containing protein 16 [Homarus americanus]